MSTEAAFLDIRRVDFGYGGERVLRGIDWRLPRGQIHCLVGRSGCGKTSLLKLAAGLLAPDAGTIRLGGQPLAGPSGAIGFMFQSPVLLEWLSVLDNVLLPISLKRSPTAEDRSEARALLERLGLEALTTRRPSQLSGGQQARAALARALILRPPLMLLDEPFAALDAMTREELQDEMLALCARQDTSALFVTHDIAEAIYLGDKVALMEQGRIVDEIDVTLPRPRRQALRDEPAFTALSRRLRNAMDAVR